MNAHTMEMIQELAKIYHVDDNIPAYTIHRDHSMRQLSLENMLMLVGAFWDQRSHLNSNQSS